MPAAADARVEKMLNFRDTNPQKFINYLRQLQKITGQLRVAFEECEPDSVFIDIYMKYVKLMADTPEMVDIDHDARVVLNDRILYLRRMFELGQQRDEVRGLLRRLVKRIVHNRGTTKYAGEVAY